MVVPLSDPAVFHASIGALYRLPIGIDGARALLAAAEKFCVFVRLHLGRQHNREHQEGDSKQGKSFHVRLCVSCRIPPARR